MARRNKEVGSNPRIDLLNRSRAAQITSVERRLRHQTNKLRRLGVALPTKEMAEKARQIDVCMRRIEWLTLNAYDQIQTLEKAITDLRKAVHSYWQSCAKWIDGPLWASLCVRPRENFRQVHHRVQERLLLSERLHGLRVATSKGRREKDVQETPAFGTEVWQRSVEAAATNLRGSVRRATARSSRTVQKDGKAVRTGVRKG